MSDEFDRNGLLNSDALCMRLEMAANELEFATKEIRCGDLYIAWERLKNAFGVAQPVKDFLDGYFDRDGKEEAKK